MSLVDGVLVGAGIALAGVIAYKLTCSEAARDRNAEAVAARALEWRAHHARGSEISCVDLSLCDDFAKCTASWPGQTTVVPFECTRDGCYAVAK